MIDTLLERSDRGAYHADEILRRYSDDETNGPRG